MSESPRTIGVYPVERELGRGGMGIVYLARDPRLGRPVAIKVLPDEMARDPERLARFEREAKLLASLNHPNIAGIHGLEETNGHRFLALEFVEGETLEHRLRRGPLSIEETVEVCRQIAAAVEAAHECGVIHRDLKPANVVIMPSGNVKVLDFGLAKGVDFGTRSGSLSSSPTETYHATAAGLVLGTAAYMSPEQARGRDVDRRTDIWSFGCVLYECLTGRKAFEGETVSDMIARILQGEPDWSALPASTPGRLRELLDRCLAKDGRHRLRDIGDARIEMEQLLASRTPSGRIPMAAVLPKPGRPWTRRVGLVAAAAAIAGAVLGAAIVAAVRPPARGVASGARLSINFPEHLQVRGMRPTPDGRALVVRAAKRSKSGDAVNDPRLFVRRLDSYGFEPLPGTEGVHSFAVMADSRAVVFVGPTSPGSSQDRLARVAIDGSAPPVTIATWDPGWESWTLLGSGDVLVLSGGSTELVRIPADGGPAGRPVLVDLGGVRARLMLDETLPGDRGVLCNALVYSERGWNYRVAVLDPRNGKAAFVIQDGGNPAYSPTGHLVFSRGEALLAAPFDLGRRRVTGPPVAIQSGLLAPFVYAPGNFTVSRDGSLFYPPATPGLGQRAFVLVDDQGGKTPLVEERHMVQGSPGISGDGRRMAAGITNAQGLDEIWVADLDRPTLRRVASLPDADLDFPILSPDGSRVIYTRHGRTDADGLYLQELDSNAPPRRLTRAGVGGYEMATSWSPDGSTILFTRGSVMDGIGEVHLMRLDAPPDSLPSSTPLLATAAKGGFATFSPGGRWIAYSSDETGRNEVYIRPTPTPGGSAGAALRVSTDGGYMPQWGEGGRRLGYVDPRGRLQRVEVTTSPSPSASRPRETLDLRSLRLAAAVPLPGGRLLGVERGEGEVDEIESCNVVPGWAGELGRRLQAGL